MILLPVESIETLIHALRTLFQKLAGMGIGKRDRSVDGDGKIEAMFQQKKT